MQPTGGGREEVQCSSVHLDPQMASRHYHQKMDDAKTPRKVHIDIEIS
jgi:hypothetical protein